MTAARPRFDVPPTRSRKGQQDDHSTGRNISDYAHTPGSPVLDRVAAWQALTGRGRPGHAIAVGDLVRPLSAREQLLVTAVDHQTGLIHVTLDGEVTGTLAGIGVEVVALAHHPSPHDGFLEGKTLEQARAAMVPFASDHGRYPQYGPGYFDAWAFGRVKQEIRWRNSPHGPVQFPAGQRVLVRADDRPVYGMSSPRTVTAWSTRTDRHGSAISVWATQIDLEA